MSIRECRQLHSSLAKKSLTKNSSVKKHLVQQVRKSSVALVSALLTSATFLAIAPTAATAQSAQPNRPSLADLINTVPERPIAPIRTTEPATVPVPAPEAATEAATEAEEESISLVLRLSARRVYVYRGDSIETSYPVAIGRPGWETPTGEFEVFHQITDPGWTNPITSEVMPPGPDNPLGDRWIAFWTDGQNSIGFHGTPNRDSVGKAASHGCIRMYNEDVRQLYSMVDVGTSVTVVQ